MTTNNLSGRAGTPEKTANPLPVGADGGKVAELFSFAGVACEAVRSVESPAAYTHYLRILNPLNLRRLKSAVEIVEYKLRAVVVCRRLTAADDEPTADFIATIDKPKADVIGWGEHKNVLTKYEYLIGVDLYNKPVKIDLDEIPHLLIAGASGAGKSVALHTIIDSLMQKPNVTGKDLAFAFIDTKQTELTQYGGSKFLACPVATTYIQAVEILHACLRKMSERYGRMAQENKTKCKDGHIVVVIDELADLMMQGKQVVEPLIVKIAQQGRAANIHLIVATQRPTVDVCTGHIKANIPARLALMTASARDSMNIIDRKGAETLRGKGDAVLRLPSEQELKRLQVFCKK